MGLFDGIKRSLAMRAMPKAINRDRRQSVSNYNTARSIGIIYREKGESFYILVKQFVKYLRAEHGVREVKALAYVDEPRAIPYYHKHKLRFDFFTPKDVNFQYDPTGDHVKNFEDNDFDILIDLEQETCYPLRFVLARSAARMKVGLYQPEWEEYYDLMLAREHESTFDDFMEELNHYLTVINTNNARA